MRRKGDYIRALKKQHIYSSCEFSKAERQKKADSVLVISLLTEQYFISGDVLGLEGPEGLKLQ